MVNRVQLNYRAPENLSPGDVFDATKFSDVEIFFFDIQSPVTIVRDLSINPTIAFSAVFDQNGDGPFSTITSSNVYSIPGGGYISFTGNAKAMVRAGFS